MSYEIQDTRYKIQDTRYKIQDISPLNSSSNSNLCGWLVGVFCMPYLKKIPLPWEMEAEGDLSACQNLGLDDTGGGTENSQQLF